MGIIKFKLLFIISSLVLVLLPADVMANTLQPGQNFNNENNEEQNESLNENQQEQHNDYSEPSGQDDWTEQEESYEGGSNNNFNNNNYNNDNLNNNDNYNDNNNNNNYNNGNENYYNNDEGNWGTQQEPVEQYEEPAQQEPVIEEPVDPEPQYEEPIEEVPVIEEPVEIEEPEPSVDVHTLDSEVFSISGEAVDEGAEGIEGIELILSGEPFDEQSVTTDEDGGFLFEEVPSGDYQIEIKPTEDYEVSESTVELEVTDRSKRGLEINLTGAEEEAPVEEEPEPSEPVETEEDVMAAETGSLSSMDWTLIGTGIVFALISLFVLLFKKVRKN